MKSQVRRGFTLVEVLIVVVVLGILASTVLPQFTSASSDAREAALVQNLQILRGQIQLYRMHHDDRLPAQGETTETKLTDVLMKRTDVDGTVNATGGKYGPYIIALLPPNPFNNLRSVRVATTDSAADGATGWIYNSATGTIKANSVGNTPSGKAFTDL